MSCNHKWGNFVRSCLSCGQLEKAAPSPEAGGAQRCGHDIKFKGALGKCFVCAATELHAKNAALRAELAA